VAFWLLVPLLSACDHDPVAEGEEVYERTCENCHGADGTAGVQVDGVAAADLTVVIPAFSDGDLETVITEGSGAMPAQDLEGREVDDVITYLRATFGD
jgi:mono/diheme cytochrome c family protein